MTTKQHAYAILRLVSPTSTDDKVFPIPFIVSLMSSTRALLIEQKFKKYEPISYDAYQSTTIDLVKEYNCPPFPCLLRSTTKIPKVMEVKRAYPLMVYDQSMTGIPYVSVKKAGLKKYSSSTKPFYFVLDGFLYIANVEDLTQVTIVGLFEKIINKCLQTTEEFCDPYDTEFPIDADLETRMYELVVNQLRNSLRVPQDTINDGRSNIQAQPIS